MNNLPWRLAAGSERASIEAWKERDKQKKNNRREVVRKMIDG